jgi:hypothetical protein
MVGQLLPNTNEMLQCILVLQNLDLNIALVALGYNYLFIFGFRGELENITGGTYRSAARIV